MTTDLARLASGKYVLLTTYRKSGEPVPTPVWVARDDDELVVWTTTNSGKVKRIRRESAVDVAPCDLRGKPQGDAVSGHARLLEADDTECVRRLIARKYGVLGWLTIFGSRLRRGNTGTIGIAITLTRP
ncbi:MAG: PPOX class F420-dependent oxidoreductase [Sciscionella sp.]